MKLSELKGYKNIKATNHDFKAIEYYIKEKLNRTSLKDVLEFVHFGLTTWDATNIAYALMISESLKDVYLPNLEEVIKQCPLDKILTETDCPFLTPLPAIALAKAGPDGYIRNEPIFVKHVIHKIAKLKEISFEEVASQTTQNAKELFNI